MARRRPKTGRLRLVVVAATGACVLAVTGAGLGAVGGAAVSAAGPTKKQVACLKGKLGVKRTGQLLKGAKVKPAEVVKLERCGLRPKKGGGVVAIKPGVGASTGSGAQPSAVGLPTLNEYFSRGLCTGRGGKLTAGVAPADEIRHWYPLGGMIQAHITPISHLYVYYPGAFGQAVVPGTHMVSSPAAGVVVQVQRMDSDYRVVVEHSCDLYSQYIHLETLAGPLAVLEGKVTFGAGWGGRIPVAAGEAIADDSGWPAFDYGLYDQRVVLPGLLRPATYLREPWKVHTVDPFPYWPESIRSRYRAKSLRRTEPMGGKLDWDVAGTARGNWFVEGTNGYAGLAQQSTPITPGQQRGYWDTHLALAYDAIDPTAVIVSVGDYAGCACQFAVRGNGPDPLSITPATGVVVYELVQPSRVDSAGRPIDGRNPPLGYRVVPGERVQGLLAVRVNANGTLTVEKLPGKTSRSAFTGFSSAAVTYTR